MEFSNLASVLVAIFSMRVGISTSKTIYIPPLRSSPCFIAFDSNSNSFPDSDKEDLSCSVKFWNFKVGHTDQIPQSKTNAITINLGVKSLFIMRYFYFFKIRSRNIPYLNLLNNIYN